MSAEHSPSSHEKVQLPTVERHEQIRSAEKERPQEKLETHEVRGEVARALEKAEPPTAEAEAAPTAAKTRTQHVISNKQKQRAYKKTMHDIQKEMSPGARTFSKIIHNKAVEDTSEVVGHTIARPTSILYGSFCAFVLLSVVYLLAKRNGFQLSGFEFIGLFAVGWAIGLLADFFRHMITGKN